MEKIGIVLHKLRSGVHGYEFKVNESTIYMPGDSGIKNSPVNSGDLGLIPGSGKIPWRRKWQHTSIFLPEEFHGQRSLAGYSHRVAKSQIGPSD